MQSPYGQFQNLSGLTLGQGRYQLEALIHAGSMGSLYMASDRHLDATVTVRVLHSHVTQDTNFAQRALLNARLGVLAPHPSLVRVFDFGIGDNLLFVVLELLPNPTLADFYGEWRGKQQWLALDEAIYLIQRLGDALLYMRHHALPARRIKPSQIMLRPEVYTFTASRFAYLPVLVDFAVDLFTHALSEPELKTSLAYLAPEVLFQLGTAEHSDIYMLGAFAWELFLGKPLFQASTSDEAVLFHRNRARSDPRALHPNLPEPLAAWLEKALAHVPEQRFANVRAMLDALASIPITMLFGITPPASTVVQIQPTALHYLRSPLEGSGGQVANQSWISQQNAARLSYVPAPIPAIPNVAVPNNLNFNSVASPLPATPAPPSPMPPPRPLWLHIQSSRHGARAIEITKDLLTIGRAEENDVVIDDQRVSRKHARLEFDGDGYFLVDLESSNGTLIDTVPIPRGARRAWHSDQVVKMGEHQLRLSTKNDAPTPTTAQVGQGSQSVPPPSSQGATPHHVPKPAQSQRVPIHVLQVEQEQYSVEPGSQVRIPLVVGNPQGVDQQLILAVQGVPGAWVSFPALLQVPADSKERVYLDVKPPRNILSKAAVYPIQISVTSPSSPSTMAQAQVQLEVSAYSEFHVELEPPVANEGESIRVLVHNQGNSAQSMKLMWWDESGQLEFTPAEADLYLEAGQSSFAEFRANGPKPGWGDKGKSCPIKVQVNAQSGDMQFCFGTITRRSRFF